MMINHMPKPKVIFFVPHPDDLEFGASLMAIEALRLGWEVTEVVMTGGEYGTERDDFKGNRLSRIREHELRQTARTYEKGTNRALRILMMGFVDGHLSLNPSALRETSQLLKRETPDVVFAPDPWHAIDFHPDHLNTGRLVYFALKSLRSAERPKKCYFYYSFKTNVALRCRRKDTKILHRALLNHQSQVSPLAAKLMACYKRLAILLQYRRNKGLGLRFRMLDFPSDLAGSRKNFNDLKDKVRHAFYTSFIGEVPSRKRYRPTPEELGIEEGGRSIKEITE